MGSNNTKAMMLHKAVVEDDADRVREMLEGEELDLTIRGEGNLNMLQLAIVNGSLKTLHVILDSQSGRADLYSLTADRQTPLILAAAKGQEEMALEFLQRLPKNVLRLQFSDTNEQQVLHYASAKGQEGLVKELLDMGVAADVVGGKLKHTPLMLAAHNGHAGVMRILLEAGAHVSAIDLAKMTPLHHACMEGSEECVKLLLQQESYLNWVNARDISGCTPLLYCLNNKHKQLERLLVSSGANLTEALDGGFSEYCYHTSQSNS